VVETSKKKSHSADLHTKKVVGKTISLLEDNKKTSLAQRTEKWFREEPKKG